MNKFIVLVSLIVAGCQSGKVQCPEEKGYGAQSDLALCSEYIESICVTGKTCVEGWAYTTCVAEGTRYCARDVEKGMTVDASVMYNECLPVMSEITCPEFLAGGFPKSCLASFNKKEEGQE